MPETLASESLCLDRGSSSLADGHLHGFVSFASMPFETEIDNNLVKPNLCELPLSSFELIPQYSLDSNPASVTSPGNLPPESQSYGLVTSSYGNNKGIGMDCKPLVSPNASHGNVSLYDIEETVASLSESSQSAPESASTLKAKAIKRVNLVKAPNSLISAMLTTLNEEDEV